jgi:hypothetical protein
MTGALAYAYILRKFKRTDKSTEVYEAMTDVISDMHVRFKPQDYTEEAYVSGISTVGEYQIALPSDFGHITGTLSIIDTADDSYYSELTKITKHSYDQLYPDRLLSDADLMNTATPFHFCIYASQLYIGPVPDKTTYRYQLNYTTENTSEIASDTAVVPFTAELRDRNILRNGVLFELHDGLENFEEAAYYKQLYLHGLEGLIERERANAAAIGENVVYHGF